MNLINLHSWMVLSTVLLGLWWLCYHLTLRSERSFAYNRAFLVLGPLLALALPLLPLDWPSSWTSAPVGLPGLSVLLPAVQVGAAEASAGASWPGWIWPLYLGGAALLLLRLLGSLGQLWLRTRAMPRQAGAGYTLLRTGGRLPTSSFGRVVFWDETTPLSPAEARQVLRHELAHVRQGHTYDHLLLELLRVLLWFNPFVHLCGRALGLTHEFLADAAALDEGPAAARAPATFYTQLLARQVAAQLGFSPPLAHSFSQSQTLTRIAMIYKTAPARRWKKWLGLPLLALSFLTVACERNADFLPPPPPPVVEAPPPPPAPAPADAPPPPPPPAYTSVEQMPELPGGGGPQAIVAQIQRNLQYPNVTPEQRRNGRVFASFIVSDQGEVQAVQIVKGMAPEYDAAVVAAIQKLPRFRPGKHRLTEGSSTLQAVPVSFTVPVQFVWAAKAN
ncbi:hypothetical protein GCM10023185_09470 [Hymenobacter saemangeumensis]|uniref:TonB C-terminal domain-containing protein n=1 Tax=Hymenobacter saemangeumensis TaxID=1084522 RepID=A0ABP8I4E6_9BACT